MHSIVTVTCTRDKWCMALQSHSLETFVKEPCTHYVIIEDEKTSTEEWKELLTPLYTTHRLVLVTKESHPEVYPTHMIGWHGQQIIKLLAHKLIDTNRYIILDSKNIFIKPTKLENFEYEGCGSRMNVTDDWMMYWFPWLQFVSQKLNKPIPNLVWVPITPFVVDKNTLSSLFSNCDFESMAIEASTNSIAVSEFLLYAFFADVNHPEITTYGGGFQGGNLRDILSHFTKIRTFAIGRIDLQNIKKRRTIESVLIHIGLNPAIVSNAVNRTTM